MPRRKSSAASSAATRGTFGDPLPRAFFERDPRIVARELLGKVLVRNLGPEKASGKKVLAARIVETEAYLGDQDLAAHAASGITPRNAVLFGPAGHAYVYFTYGMYHCMNISCEVEGRAGCVLLRALEPLVGLEEMALGRRCVLPDEPTTQYLKSLTSGPGRLCQALHITRADDNGKDVTAASSDGSKSQSPKSLRPKSERSDLQVVDDGHRVVRVITTERIGISQDRHLKLRYLIADNVFVSGPRASSGKSKASARSAVAAKPSARQATQPKPTPSRTAPTPARKLPARRARPARTPRASDAEG